MVNDALAELAGAGVLRQLDRAFASFVTGLDPASGDALAFASAMLCRMEGMGHTCLPVRALLTPDASALSGSPDSAARLARLWATLPGSVDDWCAALTASRVVQTTGVDPDRGQPLVLDPGGGEPRIYLRRYWQHEQDVASAIRQRCEHRGAAAQATAQATDQAIDQATDQAVDQAVDEAAVRRWIDRLFGASPPGTAAAGSPAAGPDWQRIACALAARSRLTLITGGPGTGKTYTAARLVALLAALNGAHNRFTVALAAPTGKAAARLRQSIEQSFKALAPALAPELDLTALGERMGPARTLHALLGADPESRKFRHHAGHPVAADLVIVDEASMIHLEMMAALLAALPARTRLVLIGDKDQLASVEAGAVLGDLCSAPPDLAVDAETARYVLATTGCPLPGPTAARAQSALRAHTVTLRDTQRFGGPIGELARAVNRDDATAVAALAQAHADAPLHVAEPATATEAVMLAVGGRTGARASHRDYLDLLARHAPPTDPGRHAQWVLDILGAFDRFRVLCALRDGPWGASGLNQAIEGALARAGLLRPTSAWYAGRPVMVTRNAPSLGVFNGDVGLALPSWRDPTQLRVHFPDGESVRAISPARLAEVETAFAITVHKSQGSEFDHAMLVLAAHSGLVLTRELLYTGITRARHALTIVSEESGLIAQAAARATQRQGGLRTLHVLDAPPTDGSA